MAKKLKAPRRPEAFYWPKHGFYTRNQFGEWVNTDKETIRMKLIRAGFSSEKDAYTLSMASSAMLDIIEKKCVHYAGNIAGCASGLNEMCGYRFLATSSPKTIEPVRGKFPLWEEILQTQYGEQTDFMVTWLKAAWLRVRAGGGPMLPALVMAGGTDTAKSLAQNHLITPLLGGRAAKPWRYWTGETQFNEDLCGSEHLMLEDEICPVKQEKRRLFGDALKASVANETTSLHPKGDKAISTKCVWAISISTNLEPQNLRVLPLHDGSLNDKLLVLKILERPKCLPDAEDYDGFLKFTAKLRAELPALAGYLQRFNPPKQCRGRRSLVEPWRDPEIMELVSEDDAVPKLLWLVDNFSLLETEMPVNGDPTDTKKVFIERSFTSMDLERELLNANTSGQAQKLLQRVNMGYLLREASKRFPARIQKDGASHNNITRWKILPEKKAD